MAENYLISDTRIVNIEEIKDIKDYILCGICYQVVTDERGPVECNSCHNQLFCTQCITGWSKTNSNCPYCHAASAKYVEISPLLLDMIKAIKFYCKYQGRGCPETFSMKGLVRHEHDCRFGSGSMKIQKLSKCNFCD